VWQAYAFVAPGGNPFDPKKGDSQQGQRFGVRSALGYLLHKAAREKRPVDLNEILADPELHKTAYVRQAKIRAALLRLGLQGPIAPCDGPLDEPWQRLQVAAASRADQDLPA
jgi:hypothetical protein